MPGLIDVIQDESAHGYLYDQSLVIHNLQTTICINDWLETTVYNGSMPMVMHPLELCADYEAMAYYFIDNIVIISLKKVSFVWERGRWTYL